MAEVAMRVLVLTLLTFKKVIFWTPCTFIYVLYKNKFQIYIHFWNINIYNKYTVLLNYGLYKLVVYWDRLLEIHYCRKY